MALVYRVTQSGSLYSLGERWYACTVT